MHTNTEWRKQLSKNIQQARQAGRVQFPIYPNIKICCSIAVGLISELMIPDELMVMASVVLCIILYFFLFQLSRIFTKETVCMHHGSFRSSHFTRCFLFKRCWPGSRSILPQNKTFWQLIQIFWLGYNTFNEQQPQQQQRWTDKPDET